MKKVGDYVLVSELGKGQFGTVYKGKNSNNEIFAVKAVNKSSVNSSSKLKALFDTEVQVMSKLKHPNLLHLYEFLETGNNYYLIIDFCKDGDFEGYLKKHQFLGEDEATYFLMQIMNGFRELHRNRIMHRDFKLANIFLNDDRLVIGDFGFAKSGFDMATTKLGSPITMAPEILLNKGKLLYTNKADIWSIGVCYFQMIFGDLPWEVNDMDDLMAKVGTQSGSKLVIPTNKGPISQECRELLHALIEPDPKKRIEWDQLFNHRLFDLHQKKRAQKDQMMNMRQSIMFRGMENMVIKMFDRNKLEHGKEVELNMEPETIKVVDIFQMQMSENDKERKIRERVLNRYSHEKRIIVFFMQTTVKLRNLGKERPTLQKAANGFMYSAILLLKKGCLLNEIAVESLKKGLNHYNEPDFYEFLKLEDKSKLLEELDTIDQPKYNKLFQHLKQKVKEEVDQSDPKTQEVSKTVEEASSGNMQALDRLLAKEVYYLVEFFSKSFNTLSKTLKYDMLQGLAHAYTAINQKEYFVYLNDGVPFDWNEFDKSWTGEQGVERMNKSLNKAISVKPL